EYFLFALRLVKRQICFLLQLSDLQSTLRTFVEQLHEFRVQLVDAATPITQIHGATSRFESPACAACFNERMRSVSAALARSIAVSDRSFFVADSISATSAEPITAASANPPKTETCPGCEIPNPTAIGNCVAALARRSNAGKSSGSESLAPVTPA